MAYAFSFWLGRFVFSTRSVITTSPEEGGPLKIEVEPLPDYLWRELGFHQPARRRRE